MQLIRVSRAIDEIATTLSPFLPGTVLPEQIMSFGVVSQPERRLLLALLEDACRCLFPRPAQPGCELSRDKRRARLGARVWFASDDNRSPFAFVVVCGHLGIDHQAFRSALAASGESIVSKLNFARMQHVSPRKITRTARHREAA